MFAYKVVCSQFGIDGDDEFIVQAECFEDAFRKAEQELRLTPCARSRGTLDASAIKSIIFLGRSAYRYEMMGNSNG